MFSQNEGSVDRDLRIVFAVILTIIAVFYLQGLLSVIVGLLALVLFATAAVGFCPIYKLIGVNTNQSKK